MKSRKLVMSAGIVAMISSLLSIVVYGLYLAMMGVYILFVMSFLLPFGALGGNLDLDVFGILGFLGAVLVIPTAIGIVALVFAIKLLGIAKMQDYYYKAQKGRLITYIVFLFIFAGIMTAYGAMMTANGGIMASNGSEIGSILATFPFGFIFAPMFLTSAILLIIDLCLNRKKIFKANIPAPELTPTQKALQQPAQQQPQIITLKPGEEIPEYLKGRLVPVQQTKKKESAEELLSRDLSALKDMLDKKLITKTEYDKLKKKRLDKK